MDAINISGLKIQTKIGVHAWEQQINQLLVLDIAIPADLSACGDKLENTIDYATLCQSVTQFVESNSFKLIETVANDVAELIKKEFQVNQLTVSVSKPHAIKNASGIQVVINR